MPEMIDYDEFAYFHENAAEWGLPYDGPPQVGRVETCLADGRTISSLRWGAVDECDARVVLIHGGAQNAHTWDTVAMALGESLVAPDLPGHGRSDSPAAGVGTAPSANATDLVPILVEHAPSADVVVGMSLGGLTAIVLAAQRPDLVRRLVLVDITPGVTSEKARAIHDFVRGPATFPSFDELLQRTIEFNPTRTESSLRRGILHNAQQLDDGSWVWRHRRDDSAIMADIDGDERQKSVEALWSLLAAYAGPVTLVRGMREQSVVTDDDIDQLRRHCPDATVVEVDAGHSVQGDQPLQLAEIIRSVLDEATP